MSHDEGGNMSKYLNYRASRIGYSSYKAYLQSPQWRVFRDKVRAKACYSCGTRDVPLQVHHVSYKRLGNEKPDDVVTLCNSCHEAIHGIVGDDISLETAHDTYRPPMEKEKKRKPRREWVSWFKLLNKSKRQTVDELRDFLVRVGLSDGEKATERAYRTGLVRIIDDKEKWNLRKYISVMQREKKREKRRIKQALVSEQP